MSNSTFQNTLYYGYNLEVLRKHVKDESVDLIYLDPPFNSKADYNVLFKEVSGEESTAQIQAFSDFWIWDTEARKAYEYLTIQAPNDVANLTDAFFTFLGKNNMLAYLVMMGERLLELHRVLKPTGSIYLHCDSTASHYLKLMMDAIFGVENFRNEIVWKRFNFHADAIRFGRVADRILFYTKSGDYTFNKQYTPLKQEYIDTKFTRSDEKGKFRLDNPYEPSIRLFSTT
jgi:site-specific DNA-methyltransferase (adenine-specific)